MDRFLIRIMFTIVLIPYLRGLNLTHKQSCQCVYLTGTQGKVWGKFMISSSEVRFNKSECLHIFITGAEQEIIELRFDIITLRKKCIDQIHIFPHLHESVLQNPGQPEDTICFENSKMFTSGDVLSSFLYPRQIPSTESPNITSNNIENVPVDINHNFKPLTRSQFRINHRSSIFSSGRVLGMRLIYSSFRKDEDAFNIVGRFQFIDRVMFKNDGNLVATTYCDYQFLPQPINYVEGKHDGDVEPWRHFYSPRYPAKYPDHIKCTYKFLGRPRNRVEVLFEEIYLLTGHISCLHNSDKITVHDSKTANMSSIIDVFCNERPTMKVTSSGPNLVIEFEASSNRTSNGFSAKYRFIDISTGDDLDSAAGKNNAMNTIISTPPIYHENNVEWLHNTSSLRNLSIHVTTTSKSFLRLGNETSPGKNVSQMYSVSSIIQPGSLLAGKVSKIENITTVKFKGHSSSSGVRVCPPGKIEKLTQLYISIYELHREIQRFYETQLLLTMGGQFLIALIAFSTGYVNAKDDIRYSIVPIASCVIGIVEKIIISFVCEMTTNEAENTGIYMSQVFLVDDQKLLKSMELFDYQLKLNQIKFDVYGIFEINNRLMGVFLLSLVGFSIVLIQFHETGIQM